MLAKLTTPCFKGDAAHAATATAPHSSTETLMMTMIGWFTRTVLLVAAVALPLAAHAQQANEKNARKPSDTRTARPAERPNGMKPCPEYGAGFYRVAGSDTCVRIGGGVGVDVGGSSYR
jgi:hypothetical protein